MCTFSVLSVEASPSVTAAGRQYPWIQQQREIFRAATQVSYNCVSTLDISSARKIYIFAADVTDNLCSGLKGYEVTAKFKICVLRTNPIFISAELSNISSKNVSNRH
jgi:hypothetical protein